MKKALAYLIVFALFLSAYSYNANAIPPPITDANLLSLLNTKKENFLYNKQHERHLSISTDNIYSFEVKGSLLEPYYSEKYATNNDLPDGIYTSETFYGVSPKTPLTDIISKYGQGTVDYAYSGSYTDKTYFVIIHENELKYRFSSGFENEPVYNELTITKNNKNMITANLSPCGDKGYENIVGMSMSEVTPKELLLLLSMPITELYALYCLDDDIDKDCGLVVHGWPVSLFPVESPIQGITMLYGYGKADKDDLPLELLIYPSDERFLGLQLQSSFQEIMDEWGTTEICDSLIRSQYVPSIEYNKFGLCISFASLILDGNIVEEVTISKNN